MRLTENTLQLLIGKFDPEVLESLGAEYDLTLVEASIVFEPHLIRGEN